MTPDKNTDQGVEIFAYTNYRSYLKDLYEYRKSTTSYFSYRYFSQKAGFSSHNVLKLIINGERNIAYASIPKFTRALDLKAKEAKYFKLLVLFAQSKNEGEKKQLLKEITDVSYQSPAKKVTELQHKMYTQWHHSAIRELVTLEHFKDDPKWIAGFLSPKIKPRQAKESLQLLEDLGLIKRGHKGRWEQTNSIIKTDNEVNKLSVSTHTRNMIHMGERSISEFLPEDREISTMSLGLSKQAAVEIKQRVQQFKDDILKFVEQDNSPSEEVYQFNTQFFPLVEKKKAK